jgi:tetratricopeptide (TPR) repeat protein
MDKAKTIAANLLVIAVISILLIWANTLYRQHTQFSKGEKALAAGDYIHAIAGYESAIHMYTPASPIVERSAKKLWQIGELMEQARDYDLALVAFRSLRSSFYAVKGLGTPGKEWIRRSEEMIAQLLMLQAQTATPAVK